MRDLVRGGGPSMQRSRAGIAPPDSRWPRSRRPSRSFTTTSSTTEDAPEYAGVPLGSSLRRQIVRLAMEGGLVPHYEIVAHVIRELDCETAEDAAAIFRRQLLADARHADTLVHLAVWREDPAPSGSPVSASIRQKLVDFF